MSEIGGINATVGTTTITDTYVSSKSIDESNTKELDYINPNWNRNLGYYKQKPELKKAIDAFVMWTCGLGYTCDAQTQADLEYIRGNGKETFLKIIMNLLRYKKINGDAYAEIVRDPVSGRIINLKVLNPQRTRIIWNAKGQILRYEEFDVNTRQTINKFKPEAIFHISNDRIANEIHGTDVLEVCKWAIDARQQAMEDTKRTLHQNTVRIIYVDADDTATYNRITQQWATGINTGQIVVLPKNAAELPDVPQISVAEHRDWIRYLEKYIYVAVGVPEIILGGSQDYTEAASKVGHLTFEQPHMSERAELEQDIFDQLGWTIEFDEPTSMKDEMAEAEAANTSQVGFQPNDIIAGVGQ